MAVCRQAVRPLFEQLSVGNVGPDCDVLVRLAPGTNERDDGRVHPVPRTILGPILNRAMPDLPVRDGMIHLPEKLFGVVTGVEDTVALAE